MVPPSRGYFGSPPVTTRHKGGQTAEHPPGTNFWVVAGRDPFNMSALDQKGNMVVVEFDAPWVIRRGIGTCWLRLPSLIGPAADYASWLAHRRLGELIDPENAVGADAGLTSAGVRPVSTADNDPPPNAGSGRWSCRFDAHDRLSLLSDCAGWADLETPWRQEARDSALLFGGVFLSFGIDLLVHGWRRRRKRRAKC